MAYFFSQNSLGEKYIDAINRNDFTEQSSTDFFNVLYGDIFDTENTLYIIVGTDSGLGLKYAAGMTLPRGSRLAFIEIDDVFTLVSTEYRGVLSNTQDCGSTGEKELTLHRASTWHETLFNGGEEHWVYGGNVRLIESHACRMDYCSQYTELHIEIIQSVKRQVIELNGPSNRTDFIDAQIRNAADNYVPLRSSKAFGKDRHAIILGGGPSLDEHLSWVKQNREKLFVISVSRISNVLNDQGIVPDAVMSVDPYDFSYEVSKQGVAWTDVPLICSFHVCPKLLQQWQGPTVYLGDRLPWLPDQAKDLIPASGGSTVSHTAVLMAWYLGFSNILMTGVDMCYSADASCHAGDSPEAAMQKLPSLCDAQVETYSGRVAGTLVGFHMGLEELEQLGSIVNEHGPKLYNLSREAAKCDSIPQIDACDVALTNDRPDLNTLFTVPDESARRKDLKNLEKEIITARHQLIKIRRACKEAKSCLQVSLNENESPAATKAQRRLKQIRASLEKQYSVYFDAIVKDQVIAFNRTARPTAFEDMTPEELYTWGSEYYDIIRKSANRMLKEIKGLEKRTHIRLEELEPDVDIRALAAKWKDDGTPGRILSWKRDYGHRLKPRDKPWAQRAAGKYRGTLNVVAGSVSQHIEKKRKSMTMAMKSLLFLARMGSRSELQSVAQNLHDLPWPYDALYCFTNGLIAQLNDQRNEAITVFQQVIELCSARLNDESEKLDSMERMIEESLSRMTQLFIESADYESALTTMGMLCEMMPAYVPGYASMLNMCGHEKFAVELLEGYTELYPADRVAFMQLNKLRGDKPEALPSTITPEYKNTIEDVMSAVLGDESDKVA